MSCPVCNLLSGKKPGSGKLCPDCSGNPTIPTTFGLYEYFESGYRSRRALVFFVPLILLTPQLAIILTEGLVLTRSMVTSAALMAGSSLVWVIILLAGRGSMSLSHLRKQRDKVLADLFVAKAAGNENNF